MDQLVLVRITWKIIGAGKLTITNISMIDFKTPYISEPGSETRSAFDFLGSFFRGPFLSSTRSTDGTDVTIATVSFIFRGNWPIPRPT